MLKSGVTQPERSEWASPILLVPTTVGSRRFYVDYRVLNEVTVKDKFILPRMEE